MQGEWLLPGQAFEEQAQAVLGQAVGVARLADQRLAQLAVLQAVFQAGTGNLHTGNPGLHHTLDEPVVGHQVVLQVEQPLIVGQAGPGQVHQRIDAFTQRADVQLRVMHIGADELDLVEPRHRPGSIHVARNGTHPVAARQQRADQVPADKTTGSGNQHCQAAHRMVSSGTAITNRPPHSRTCACCWLTS